MYLLQQNMYGTAKERLKSSTKESRNKVCELCFFCHSVCFCPICSHCPQCCSCSLSRRLPTALLADLGPPGCKSKRGVNFEGGLCATIQTQIPSSTIPPDGQWLCTPPERHLLKGGCTNPVAQKGSRDGKGSSISSLFQQTIHSSQTKSKMATNLGPQCSGETPHEAHPVAPQKTLESSRIPGKGDSSSKVSSSAPSMVDQGDKCLDRPASAPFVSCHSDLYRRLKRRLGRSLRRLHGKRHLVSSRKSSSYKFPGTKSCLTSHEKIPAPSTGKVVLVATDHTTVVAYINKEGGMRSGSG